MTTNQRILIGTGIWSARMIALAITIAAVAEAAQMCVCIAKERK